MDTITIYLKHPHAKKLLQDLEDLDLIELVDQPLDKDQKIKPSQLRGFLSKEKASSLLVDIADSKNEWEERFPLKENKISRTKEEYQS